ncbi:MAG: hypothetical protein ACI8SR_000877 [Oceanicoccus sp.]|jgi:hypothetical protein
MQKNTWHSVDNHPELLFGQYVVPNFVSNSVAIKISDAEFVLISPGEPLLTPWLSQFSNKIKLHIIFPNSYHHLGVIKWLTQFNDVTLYASQTAIEQLKHKGFSNHPILPLETKQPTLPQGYDILFPPGHRGGDIWLRKQAYSPLTSSIGSTWITCDSFLNYERMSNQPFARFMQKILGAAPNLKISQVVKWFILTDRQKFKSWALNLLKTDNPTTLIPSHGEIQIDSNLAQKIAGIIEQRL